MKTIKALIAAIGLETLVLTATPARAQEQAEQPQVPPTPVERLYDIVKTNPDASSRLLERSLGLQLPATLTLTTDEQGLIDTYKLAVAPSDLDISTPEKEAAYMQNVRAAYEGVTQFLTIDRESVTAEERRVIDARTREVQGLMLSVAAGVWKEQFARREETAAGTEPDPSEEPAAGEPTGVPGSLTDPTAGIEQDQAQLSASIERLGQQLSELGYTRADRLVRRLTGRSTQADAPGLPPDAEVTPPMWDHINASRAAHSQDRIRTIQDSFNLSFHTNQILDIARGNIAADRFAPDQAYAQAFADPTGYRTTLNLSAEQQNAGSQFVTDLRTLLRSDRSSTAFENQLNGLVSTYAVRMMDAGQYTDEIEAATAGEGIEALLSSIAYNETRTVLNEEAAQQVRYESLRTKIVTTGLTAAEYDEMVATPKKPFAELESRYSGNRGAMVTDPNNPLLYQLQTILESGASREAKLLRGAKVLEQIGTAPGYKTEEREDLRNRAEMMIGGETKLQ